MLQLKKEMTQVFESPIENAGNIGGIYLGGWDRTRVVSSLLVFTLPCHKVPLLENCSIRSLLYYKISYWQALPDMFNRNYKACVLLPRCYIIAVDKLKLTFIIRKPSLLCSVSHASYHYIMMISSRLVAFI